MEIVQGQASLKTIKTKITLLEILPLKSLRKRLTKQINSIKVEMKGIAIYLIMQKIAIDGMFKMECSQL